MRQPVCLRFMLLLLGPALAQQRACPQAGAVAPLPPTDPPPASGPGSRADILAAFERVSTPASGASPASAAAAAAALLPIRAALADTRDCKASALMYEFALALLPARAPLTDVFESLRLDVDCGAPQPPPAPEPAPLAHAGWGAAERAASCGGGEWVVDARVGVDEGVGRGTRAAPLRTVGAALTAIRSARAALSAPAPSVSTRACIVLRGSLTHPHFLGETISLTSEDSHLAFVADGDDAEPSWVSGGVPLLGLSAWTRYGVSPTTGDIIWVCDVPATIPITSMPSLLTLSPHRRLNNAQFPNYDVETESADGEVNAPWGGGGCVSEWHKAPLFPLPNVYWRDLTGQKNDSTMDCYNHYSTGTGGACAHWTGDMGGSGHYYCGNSSDGGWVEVDALMNSQGLMLYPVAMTVNATALERDYNHTFDAWDLPPLDASWENAPTLTVWQGSPGGGGGWYNNRFVISGYDVSTHTMNLSTDGVWPAGGWQGGRTWHTLDAPQGGHTGPLIGGNWHVNNIFSELDAQGEYFFSPTERKLFFIYNASLTPSGQAPPPPGSPPPPSLELIAPTLEVFFNLTGTPSSPVVDVSWVGLGFRDQVDSMLKPWMVPSGGDWALRRAGAIHLHGVERVTVSQCAFVRTDGTAVHLDGYARNVSVEDSEFAWLGMNAVSLMGNTREEDASGGEQPWGTVIARNLARELGIIEKQSSAVFLGKAALTRIEGNVFMNGPRAFINWNDNIGGGDVAASNAIWNSCRESGDHGPQNSWNRAPYKSRIATRGGDVTFAAALSETRHSFIIANDGGSQAFDNDDGSAFFHTHENFFYSSDGFKMDYGGHDSIFESNIVVVRPYDGQSCLNTGGYVPGHETRIMNNTCILPPTGSHGNPHIVDVNLGGSACEGLPPGSGVPIVSGNAFFTADGIATASCGNGTDLAIPDMPPPMEAGSTQGVIPSDNVIIAWGRAKLIALQVGGG